MEFSELIRTGRAEALLLPGPGQPPVRGTLCITSHHLLLSDGHGSPSDLWLLLRNVDAVEKRVAGNSGTITLKCKDLNILQLEIEGLEETLDIACSIEALSSLESVTTSYPFFYRPQGLRLGDSEYLHPPDDFYQQVALKTNAWRLSTVNRDFYVCASYPPALVVPCAIGDEALARSAHFRQGGRFPVLCYYHSINGTVMLRSSQPLQGANRRRCAEDELLLLEVLALGGGQGLVVDTRSAQAVKQARLTGGGTEAKAAYPGWKRLHRPLERGRPLQDSFVRLVEACTDPSLSMDRWLSRLDGCRWLTHVKEALTTASLVAQGMDREGICILVHGTEGTDATLLVTSLAQLILDPKCRTMRGFQSLLEREWIQAGHPFQQRCAHSAYTQGRPKNEAPVFLLFLDCVWQLSRQFPLSLEFGEGMLLALFDHAYASPFGTFLCNSEKERYLCEVKTKTHSLWSSLNQSKERKRLCNPIYSPNPLALWPSVEPQSLQLWAGKTSLRFHLPSLNPGSSPWLRSLTGFFHIPNSRSFLTLDSTT
ncbi:myotubularin-related protein 9-like isoform X2 [Macrotis lagotis]|uniref:myotubularin-related protein 9-like isoform X2 n=1 Tax=Macrotis lagotis TaxID=92651 RepID=UPI003D684CB5